MTDETLPKKKLIRSPRDYKKVGAGAKRKNSKYFTLLYKQGQGRLGITISNKVGNSPERKYLKRCIKEVFRKNKIWFNGVDVILIAKPEMNSLEYQQILDEIRKAVMK